ncbi:hypothetical protein F2P56_033383 [Juglans regia]|uniref:Uncharacterized protein LOC108985594 n=2 Tax=Juglans regia TaxID=51240 RepID=A0A2I4E264_JUGRE|nr:uncharacterized protein LOC108985594 [Juglans regia]KAF5447865.1 hypothetical protein F2P56_033383 [Juglans regia]
MSQNSVGQSSAHSNHKEIWPKIWKLQVPSAVRIFLWRASHDSLPTNLNLCKRKIRIISVCPICKLESESVLHALWSCPSVQDVWAACSRSLQKMKVSFTSFKEVVEHVLSNFNEEDAEELACTAYKVWRKRNTLVFEEKFEDPLRVVLSASHLSKEFKEANWDASVDRLSSRVGVGVVVRNWEGRVIAILRAPRKLFPNAKLAESVAALRAVLFCKNLGITRLLLEGDTLSVVKDLNSETLDWRSTGLIIQDIKEELKSLSLESVHFISRLSNCIAHCLAKDALKLSEESISMEGVPPCIQHLFN